MEPLAELAAAAGGDQLGEAMAGLHRIAVAAGLYEATWAAGSVTEVSEIIAAWCHAQRGITHLPGGGGVIEVAAAVPIAARQPVLLAPSGAAAPAGPGQRPFGSAIGPARGGGRVYVRVQPAWHEIAPGDWITYRSVHAGQPPHRAQVERVADGGDGVIVLDEQPGMPLTHKVTWNRVIGKTAGGDR
jgi:hypothetical protein